MVNAESVSSRVRNASIVLLLMWGIVEAGLWGLLAFGRRMDKWDYRPIDTRALTPEQRSLVLQMLSGEGYIRLDPSLGWTSAAGGRSKDGLYRINGQELRADRLYTQHVPPGTLRLAAFGDSFTFGAFVDNAQTWEAQLEASDPRIEVLNYGVNGFGPDQAYLRYEQTAGHLGADVVVIGYMSENLARLVNRFRPYYIPLEKVVCSKPRYELGADDALTLLDNPLKTPEDYQRLLSDPGDVLPELAEHDYWAQMRNERAFVDILPSVRVVKILLHHLRRRVSEERIFETDGTYHVGSPAYRILVAVLERFYRSVEARSQIPIILIYPRLEDGNGRPSYAPLLTDLDSRHMRHIEVLPELVKEVGGSHLADLYFDGHLNAKGNGIVARQVARSLHELRIEGHRPGS
jgi:hypothetical protein